MVGEVARGLSLFGGASWSSEVRRCNCSVVDESRSSLAGLAARCVSFYRFSIYLSIYCSVSWVNVQAATATRVATQPRRCTAAASVPAGRMAPVGASTLHTVFTSECNNVQFDWFATGVFESFRASGESRPLAATPPDRPDRPSPATCPQPRCPTPPPPPPPPPPAATPPPPA
eukprot:scaffold1659_cov33-Phaeocystis_antarctica.AAC.1